MDLIARLQKDFPGFTFAVGSHASWSPRQSRITYVDTDSTIHYWGLFHELGHAVAGHQDYCFDTDLLQMELQAWRHAEKLGAKYGYHIDQEHIEDCLDTYRDWLDRRSTCPQCQAHGLQSAQRLYRCHNCGHTWQVSPSRWCRAYRRTLPIQKQGR